MKKARAMIHSLGQPAEVEIVLEQGDSKVIAKYNNTYCTAIYNIFVGLYYVDDIYGVLNDQQIQLVKRGIMPY